MKKIISLLLVLTMVSGLVGTGISAFAEEEAPETEEIAETVSETEPPAEETEEDPAEPAEQPAAEESAEPAEPAAEEVPADAEETPAEDLAEEETIASEEPAAEETAPAADGEEAPQEISLYVLTDEYTEYLTVPDDHLQSYTIDGWNISLSNRLLTLDDNNTLTPRLTTWYWYGGYGYSVPIDDEEPTSITHSVNTGD